MKTFTTQDAETIANYLKLDVVKIPIEKLLQGMNVELEHGSMNPTTNVTNDSNLVSAKIALAHLNERLDYYDRLAEMEGKAVGVPVTQAETGEVMGPKADAMKLISDLIDKNPKFMEALPLIKQFL